MFGISTAIQTLDKGPPTVSRGFGPDPLDLLPKIFELGVLRVPLADLVVLSLQAFCFAVLVRDEVLSVAGGDVVLGGGVDGISEALLCLGA